MANAAPGAYYVPHGTRWPILGSFGLFFTVSGAALWLNEVNAGYRQVFLDLGENAILLCHEPPGQFCHRRLVAAWLEKFLNIVVPESHYREPKVML